MRSRLIRAGILASALAGALALAPTAQERGAERDPAAPRGGAISDPWDDETDRLIFFAVLEGLYEDGVGDDVVARIGTVDERSGMPTCFVYACPLCMPAWRALEVYRGRPAFAGHKLGANTFGEGLSAAERERLLAADDAVVRAAVMPLVLRWVERRLERMRPTPEERAVWTRRIEERAKKGAAQLADYRAQGFGTPYGGMQSCPICDGAAGACAR